MQTLRIFPQDDTTLHPHPATKVLIQVMTWTMVMVAEVAEVVEMVVMILTTITLIREILSLAPQNRTMY
jgi:hypothetical protein